MGEEPIIASHLILYPPIDMALPSRKITNASKFNKRKTHYTCKNESSPCRVEENNTPYIFQQNTAPFHHYMFEDAAPQTNEENPTPYMWDEKALFIAEETAEESSNC